MAERIAAGRRRSLQADAAAQRQTLASARRVGLLPEDTVVVAVSGGPDSSALLDVVTKLNASQELGFGFRVHAGHLIHDFRGQEKYDDAQFVRDFCEARGCPLTVEEVDVGAYQRQRRISSFEQAARDLRYEFLGRVAQMVDARFVALAHTADDLAETVLLHVARGSGAHGLRGMTENDRWPYGGNQGKPRLWRPLIGVKRSDTIAYCCGQGIDYRDDTTNYMQDFARNRVRLNIMPALADQLNPKIVDALGRLARTSATQLDFLEQCVEERWPEIAPEPPAADGTVKLRRDKLSELHPALQSLALRRAWKAVTGSDKRLAESHLNRMAHLAQTAGSGKMVALPGQRSAIVRGDWLTIYPVGGTEDCPFPVWPGDFRITLPFGPIATGVTRRGNWEVTAETVVVEANADLAAGEPMQAYLSPAALADGATARSRRPGDQLQPLGMAGRRKLKDMFNDAGISSGWRDRVPLVATPAGIAWLVGVRVADWAAARRDENGQAEAVRLTFQIV